MKCERCNFDLNFVYQDTIESDKILNTKEYYCPQCKSCLIETYNQNEIVKSEWIDFNGK